MTELVIGLTAVVIAVDISHGEEPTPQINQRLLDRSSFDRIILKQSAGGAALDVLTLDLPQRPLASVPAAGTLKVKLVERPGDDFEVDWAAIDRVQVFEQLLLDEARRLTATGDFDAAYDYFARLNNEFPKMPALPDAVSDYLRGNALALFKSKQHDRALAVLLTLYKHDPTYSGLESAIETVAGQIIEDYLRIGSYAAARGVLSLWKDQFGELGATAATGWQQRFEAAATRQVEEAQRLLRQKQYVAARKAVGKALAIWPNLEAAANSLAQIQREFPFVTVGVTEIAPRQPAWRIDSWPSLRTSRLTQRLLVEEVEFGTEGGVYRSPFGDLSLGESGRELTLQLHDSRADMTADGLSRYLLSVARPSNSQFRSDIASLLNGVSMTSPSAVQLHLSRVHVRPESLLQIPPPPAARSTADFSIADHTADQVVFAASSVNRQPAELDAIVEQRMPDDEAAIAALLAGEIDVLDRVPPWQLERLRAVEGVRVESYRLPTVHVLIPNMTRPLLAKREFRRAVCYGIDRQWFVQKVLLAGGAAPGFEVQSGPFPAGVSVSDPLRYGYSNRVAPRPFEPRLAAILATIAWSTAQESASDKLSDDVSTQVNVNHEIEPTDIPALTLAHSSDPVARLACQTIESQLERAGIPITLHEVSTDELATERDKYDLRYAELAVWEPVTDARAILGPGGLAGDLESPYLNAALRQLDEATNWNDVRARLAELHDIAHHELPVIPLWQTVNYFAYRTTVRGIGETPLTLYQNVEQWSPPTRSIVKTQRAGGFIPPEQARRLAR